MAMWIPEVYAVLASFFQDDISCFMANDWFQESFLNSLYDFALCSPCSSINSLAFFLPASTLILSMFHNEGIVSGPSDLQDAFTLGHIGVGFSVQCKECIPRVSCSMVLSSHKGKIKFLLHQCG